MSEEDILRKKLDRINKNSHYGIMIDTEITKIVRSHIKRLEETKMNATSVQVINNVKDMSVTIERGPFDETRIIINVSTDDDTYEINCTGDGCEKFLRKNDFLHMKEYEYVQNQLMEREKEIRELKQQLQQVERDKKRLTGRYEGLDRQYNGLLKDNKNLIKCKESLKSDLDLEKAANEAHHRFFRQYAGKGTEIEFNRSIGDVKEVTYVIVDKEKYQSLKDMNCREVMINGKAYNFNQLVNYVLELEELKTPTIENFADEELVDNVNHPSHYTGKYECIDVMQDVFGDEATNDFCLCNAFKYIWRARKKNGLEDVKKAVWYLNKYIEEAEKDGQAKDITGT